MCLLKHADTKNEQAQVRESMILVAFDFLIELLSTDAKEAGGLTFISTRNLEYFFYMFLFHGM